MAPNAALRPFQMAALCSALWLMRPPWARIGLAIAGSVPAVGDLLVRAFHLDDQQRLDVERIAGLANASQTWIAGLSMNSMATG